MSARFHGLSLHTHSTEPFHTPSSGRLQMRAAVGTTNRSAAAAAARSPLRHILSATISAGSTGADGPPPSQTPRAPSRVAPLGFERFSLLVDGEYYGPFAHMLIGPCAVPRSSEALTLPIATFFCVDEDGTAE